MSVGEKADIGCPSATAYGAKAKPNIPANSDLISMLKLSAANDHQ